MSGANTFAAMDGKPRELNQGGTSTSIIQFSVDGTTFVKVPIKVALIAGGTGATAYNKPVQIRAWGRVATPTASTYVATLSLGTSTSSTAVIEASTAVSVATGGSAPWRIQSELMFDLSNNRAFGMGISQVGATVATLTTLDNGITPDLSTAAGLQYYFFVGGTFGTGTATNVAYLDGFELSTID